MLRSSTLQLDTWRAHYHRIRIPRQIKLDKYVRSVERKRVRQQQMNQQMNKNVVIAAGQNNANTNNTAESYASHLTAASGAPTPADTKQNPTGTVPYKYNRYFVNDTFDFVAQHQFVEDPDVTQQRRVKLPEPTSENLWKQPRSPFFEPFAPYMRIVDYGKDPDFKYMKPTNVPRWKDFMTRKTVQMPRTWY